MSRSTLFLLPILMSFTLQAHAARTCKDTMQDALQHVDTKSGVTVPVAPPSWGSMILNPFRYLRERDAYANAVKEKIALVGEQTRANETLTRKISKVVRMSREHNVKTSLEARVEEALADVDAAPTPELVNKIVEDVRRELRAERHRIEEVSQARGRAEEAAEKTYQALLQSEPSLTNSALRYDSRKEIRSAHSAEEADLILKTFLVNVRLEHDRVRAERIDRIAREAEEARLHGIEEAARRQRELRFDLETAGNSADLAKVTGRIFESVLGEPTDLSALVPTMEREPPIKRFVYAEMQVARLAKKSLDSSVIEGLKARLKNDVEIAKRLVRSSKDNDVAWLKAMEETRSRVRRLNSPATLLSIEIAGARLKRTLTPLEREALLAEALDKPELVKALADAASVLQAPAALPQLPSAPSQKLGPAPEAPEFSKSRAKSSADYGRRKKREFEQFKREVESYRNLAKQWLKYKEQLEAYKAKIEPYKTAVATYRAALAHRQKSRAAYVQYLAIRVPAVEITNRQALVKNLAERREKIVSSLKQEDGQRLQGSANRETSPSMMDWMMLFYTENPMWLINRDVAMMQLLTTQMAKVMESAMALSSADQKLVQDLEKAALGSSGIALIAPNAGAAPDATAASNVGYDRIDDVGQIHLGADPALITLPDVTLEIGAAAIPHIDVPTLPQIEIPTFEMPTIPDIAIPTIPDIQIPDVPSYSTPDVSSYSTPDFSSYSAPTSTYE